jgi:hypothetical protein
VAQKVNSLLLPILLKEVLFLKAAVYHGPQNIKVEDVPEPQVKGRKVLVKFKSGSICGTDLGTVGCSLGRTLCSSGRINRHLHILF